MICDHLFSVQFWIGASIKVYFSLPSLIYRYVAMEYKDVELKQFIIKLKLMDKPKTNAGVLTCPDIFDCCHIRKWHKGPFSHVPRSEQFSESVARGKLWPSIFSPPNGGYYVYFLWIHLSQRAQFWNLGSILRCSPVLAGKYLVTWRA